MAVYDVPANPAPGTLKWCFDSTNDPNDTTIYDMQGVAAIDPEGTLYATATSDIGLGAVFAVDSAGSLRWKYIRDPDGTRLTGIYSKPALGVFATQGGEDAAGGFGGDSPSQLYRLFFGCSDGRLPCLSSHGVLLWKSADLDGSQGYQMTTSAVVSATGLVFVGLDGDTGDPNFKNLFAFAPGGTGSSVQPVWSVHVPGGICSAVMLVEAPGSTDVVVISLTGHAMRFTYPQTTYRWDRPYNPAGGGFITHPVITEDSDTNLLEPYAIQTHPNYIYAIRYSDGLSKLGDHLATDRITYAHRMNDPNTTGPFGQIEGDPCLGLQDYTPYGPTYHFYLGTRSSPEGAFLGEKHILYVTIKMNPTTGKYEGDAGTLYVDPDSENLDPLPTVAAARFAASLTPRLIFMPESGNIHVTDLIGNPIPGPWSTPNPTAHSERPGVVVDASGAIYVGSSDGRIWAYQGPGV